MSGTRYIDEPGIWGSVLLGGGGGLPISQLIGGRPLEPPSLGGQIPRVPRPVPAPPPFIAIPPEVKPPIRSRSIYRTPSNNPRPPAVRKPSYATRKVTTNAPARAAARALRQGLKAQKALGVFGKLAERSFIKYALGALAGFDFPLLAMQAIGKLPLSGSAAERLGRSPYAPEVNPLGLVNQPEPVKRPSPKSVANPQSAQGRAAELSRAFRAMQISPLIAAPEALLNQSTPGLLLQTAAEAGTLQSQAKLPSVNPSHQTIASLLQPNPLTLSRGSPRTASPPTLLDFFQQNLVNAVQSFAPPRPKPPSNPTTLLKPPAIQPLPQLGTLELPAQQPQPQLALEPDLADLTRSQGPGVRYRPSAKQLSEAPQSDCKPPKPTKGQCRQGYFQEQPNGTRFITWSRRRCQ
jgi:hypothetical protein